MPSYKRNPVIINSCPSSTAKVITRRIYVELFFIVLALK